MTPERTAAEEAAAIQYADVWRRVGPNDRATWLETNADIIERWSMTALRRIKRRAWAILAARAERWNDHVTNAGPFHSCGAECRQAIEGVQS